MISAIGISIWVIVKIAGLILMAMYLVFALVMVRQVRLMTDTLQLGFETPVILFSYIHLVFAVIVFFAALFIL